jgi:hypothetical protein
MVASQESAKRKTGEKKMTVTELLRHNFDKIFIERDPVKREGMMRNVPHAATDWRAIGA